MRFASRSRRRAPVQGAQRIPRHAQHGLVALGIQELGERRDRPPVACQLEAQHGPPADGRFGVGQSREQAPDRGLVADLPQAHHDVAAGARLRVSEQGKQEARGAGVERATEAEDGLEADPRVLARQAFHQDRDRLRPSQHAQADRRVPALGLDRHAPDELVGDGLLAVHHRQGPESAPPHVRVGIQDRTIDQRQQGTVVR